MTSDTRVKIETHDLWISQFGDPFKSLREVAVANNEKDVSHVVVERRCPLSVNARARRGRPRTWAETLLHARPESLRPHEVDRPTRQGRETIDHYRRGSTRNLSASLSPTPSSPLQQAP